MSFTKKHFLKDILMNVNKPDAPVCFNTLFFNTLLLYPPYFNTQHYSEVDARRFSD